MKDLVTADPPTSIPGGLNERNHFALRLGRIWWVFSAGVRSALGSHPVWGCYMGRTGRLMLCCAQTRTWHLCCLPPTGTFIGEMTLHYTFSLVINTAIEPTELLHNITRIHNITRLHFPATSVYVHVFEHLWFQTQRSETWPFWCASSVTCWTGGSKGPAKGPIFPSLTVAIL